MVPFFDGTKEQLTPHIRMLNQLGFKKIESLDLKLESWADLPIKKNPYTGKTVLGIKHVWAIRIAELLDQVEGPKILYTFSNPSSCALEALEMRGKNDVIAMICDGGPFDLMWECGENLLKHYYGWKNTVVRKSLNFNLYWMWAADHHESLKRSLAALPPGFPILSIRAEKDELVPPRAIDAAFGGHNQIGLEVLNIPEAKHLKGLKEEPTLYKSAILEFLKPYVEQFPPSS